jgi:Domain of unknown function (DUF397)
MTREQARAVLSATPGRTSTYSNDSACVAVIAIPGCPWVGIQDHKAVTSQGTPTIVVSPVQFRRFIDSLR